MVKKEVSRRDFVKATAVTLAVAAAGGTMSTVVGCTPQGGGGTQTGDTQTFSAVCRFCGCGCGVLCEVDTANNKLVSVTGDPDNQSNRGLNCVKGYYLAKVLYGEDRLTVPLIRDDKATKGTAEGLREATWEEALDLVATTLKTQWKADKTKIAFWASGQQPIVEGYLLSKFWKAGLLSNNIDPNARLCMASAVVAFMNVFGTDEPAGCYEDIDLTDVFVTWGANMAEAHPMLYSRLVARKLADENVKHYDLGTIKTRTTASADEFLEFRPGTDNAIACAIANYLITNNAVDDDFITKNVIFQYGDENLGNAYEDTYDATPLIQHATGAQGVTATTREDYASRLAPYTFEYASELSGVPAADIQKLAEEFADPDKKILSLWTMGVNQHNRGVWMNHNIYNLHLLTGKIAKPGCGPFSLTGQPTACGTAREVGTFSHRLPADLLVANGQHRRFTEACWGLPAQHLEGIAAPGPHTVAIFRNLSKGVINFLWSAHNNWAVSMPRLTRFLGMEQPGGLVQDGVKSGFIVVNEVYPTLSTQYADVVFPAAMWIEREGQFGNAERRTTVFEKALNPPGEAKWDAWIMLAVAQRVLDGEMIGDKDAFDVLFGAESATCNIWDKAAGDFVSDDQREITKIVWDEYLGFVNYDYMNNAAKAIEQDANNTFGTTDAAGTYTASKMKMEAKRLAPYDAYLENHGISWPVYGTGDDYSQYKGTKWRFSNGSEEGMDNAGVTAYSPAERHSDDVVFYKTPALKPKVVFRPYEPPAEEPDAEFPFFFCTGRLLEHWHTGSMTRRVPELQSALPEALLDMNSADISELGLQDGDMVKITSRHGSCTIKVSTAGRTEPPKGVVFAPFFDDNVNGALINLVVEDYYDPLSKEPDYKKTCVKIEKA